MAENGRLAVRGFTVKALVQLGWHVRDVQVSGGPQWSGEDGYDITAKGDPSATDDQLRQMVQALLTERFQLVFHREMRELPVYAMVLGKGGTKLHESDVTERPGTNIGAGLISAQKIRMSILAQLLSSRLDRPVLDQTGLTARYDFKLEWIPDDGPDTPSPANLAGSSIFTAIQEQLGLRLEVQKGPVEVLVIDRVERPTDN